MKKFLSIFIILAFLVPSISFADSSPLFKWTANDTLVATGNEGSTATFARASAAYETNISTGLLTSVATNTARFEMVGGETAFLGEPESTNKALYSEEFDNATWIKTRSSISANAVDAPDGNTTADKLVEDSSAATTHYLNQVIVKENFTDDVDVTFSVYAKQGERTWITLTSYNKAGAGYSAYFNLSTGEKGTVTGGASSKITSAPNDFYRCSITIDISNGASNLNFRIWIAEGNNDVTFDGDGSSGLYIWGAQVEELVVPSSYIKTTNAAATRATENGHPYWALTANLTSLFAETLGADELGGDGDCTTDFFDNKGAGWSHDAGNGEYDCDGSQTAVSSLQEDTVVTVGNVYKVVWTVKNYSAGNVKIFCGGTASGPWVSANDTYSHYVTAAGGSHFYIQADSDFVGSVDDITVKEVTNASANGGPPEGCIFTGWRPKFDYDEHTDDGTNNIVNIKNVAGSSIIWLYDNLGLIYSRDSANTDSTYDQDYATDTWYTIYVEFGYLSSNVAKLRLGVDAAGAGINWDATPDDYSGSFSPDTNLRIGYNYFGPMYVRDLRIYDYIADSYPEFNRKMNMFKEYKGRPYTRGWCGEIVGN